MPATHPPRHCAQTPEAAATARKAKQSNTRQRSSISSPDNSRHALDHDRLPDVRRGLRGLRRGVRARHGAAEEELRALSVRGGAALEVGEEGVVGLAAAGQARKGEGVRLREQRVGARVGGAGGGVGVGVGGVGEEGLDGVGAPGEGGEVERGERGLRALCGGAGTVG